MKAQNTTAIFLITLLATSTFAILDQVLPGNVGDRMLTVMVFLGMFGCIISFFVALVAAFKADVPKEIM